MMAVGDCEAGMIKSQSSSSSFGKVDLAIVLDLAISLWLKATAPHYYFQKDEDSNLRTFYFVSCLTG
jgi:hypothetical protein